ncbi:hypothetical protein CRYUN_Cryun22dG0088600 [Craigia yunnanensis]
MLKMMFIFCFCFFCFLGLTSACQESIEYLNLYDTTPEVIHALSHNDLPIAVSVNDNVLREVSSSVLKADSWLRLHILAHFPAIKITTILVGDTILCQKDQGDSFGHLLPSLKNIYHSLTRWGLEKDIKVSAAFSSSCLHQNSALLSDDLQKVIGPPLEFFQNTNSTYSISPPPNVSSSLHESLTLLSSHLDFMKKFGSFKITKLKSHIPHSTLLLHQPSISFPSDSPPPSSFPISPEMSPPSVPASSPNGFYLPPCNPADNTAPTQEPGVVQKLWCVAKPSVPGIPAETLQEAMDYACGEGGTDCEEIMPHGSCFYPDIVVAHASYAFNSYWQKIKRNGVVNKYDTMHEIRYAC